MNMIEMQVAGLFVDASSGVPIVVLNNDETQLVLPIWVGVAEARAISLAVNNMEPTRPLTHDLYLSTIEQLGYSLQEARINGLQSDAYTACLVLQAKGFGSSTIEVDSRPSDAIALATACGAKVFVSMDILNKMGIKQSNIKVKAGMENMRGFLEKAYENSDIPVPPKDDEFRNFLKDLKASDFKLPDGDDDSANL
jgi:uncharacterized protein